MITVGFLLKMGPREFADRSDMGWQKKKGVKKRHRFLSGTTRMGLPLAEIKTTTGDGLEAMRRN